MNDNPFSQYLETKSLFKKDRNILRASYVPEKLPHREGEINTLASILSTALKGERPSNVLIFGKTGTGKTAVVKHLEKELYKIMNQSDAKIDYVYINCQLVDTPYGILYNIGSRFISEWSEQIPWTGWSTEKVYNTLRDKIDGGAKGRNRIIIAVLDELDRLVYKSGDEVLYHIMRINDDLKNAKVSIIGISNDLKFTEFLDPRVQSRLSEERMIFHTYNADQLFDILKERAALAVEPDVISPGVLSLISAYTAQEHGDARKALDLLRVSIEIAERSKESRVTEIHVNKAKKQMELDTVAETVRNLPDQSKLVLLSIILGEEARESNLTTGEVYDIYCKLCRKTGLDPLTLRRVTDMISELDMQGIIRARVKYNGRYGRTRDIRITVPAAQIKKLLTEEEFFRDVRDYKLVQKTLI
jgi:cell division control protein 6